MDDNNNELSNEHNEFDDFQQWEPYDQTTLSVNTESQIESDNLELKNIICITIIILTNAIIHLLWGNTDNSFHLRGINYEYLFLNHEYGRLISHMFIHANLDHLANNMIALFCLGQLVEKKLGSLRTVIIYFSSGILSGLLNVIMDHIISKDAMIYSAGASGAVYGIMCSSFILIFMDKKGLTPRTIRNGTIAVIIIAILSYRSGVSIWAHIFGALIGGIVTFLLTTNRWKNFEENTYFKIFAILITLLFCIMGFGEANNRQTLKDLPDERIDFIVSQPLDDTDPITFGELLDYCTNDGHWEAFKSDDNKDIVDFIGNVNYQNKNRVLHIQFTIDEDSYKITYFALDDVVQTSTIAIDFLQYWINQYNSQKIN